MQQQPGGAGGSSAGGGKSKFIIAAIAGVGCLTAVLIGVVGAGGAYFYLAQEQDAKHDRETESARAESDADLAQLSKKPISDSKPRAASDLGRATQPAPGERLEVESVDAVIAEIQAARAGSRLPQLPLSPNWWAWPIERLPRMRELGRQTMPRPDPSWRPGARTERHRSPRICRRERAAYPRFSAVLRTLRAARGGCCIF